MQSATETVVNTVYLFPMNEVVIGFAVVVVLLLAILIAVLRRPGAKASAAQAAYPTASAPAVSAGVDGAVVAAIAAAVAMMGQAEGKRLVVRAVRRESGWSDAGRRESVY